MIRGSAGGDGGAAVLAEVVVAERDLLDGLEMAAGSADRTRLLAAWAARYGLGLVERVRELARQIEGERAAARPG